MIVPKAPITAPAVAAISVAVSEVSANRVAQPLIAANAVHVDQPLEAPPRPVQAPATAVVSPVLAAAPPVIALSTLPTAPSAPPTVATNVFSTAPQAAAPSSMVTSERPESPGFFSSLHSKLVAATDQVATTVRDGIDAQKAKMSAFKENLRAQYVERMRNVERTVKQRVWVKIEEKLDLMLETKVSFLEGLCLFCFVTPFGLVHNGALFVTAEADDGWQVVGRRHAL